MQVVGGDAVAGPLREEAGSDQNNQTVAVALGPPKLRPAVALKLLLELDGVADLLQLELDDLVVHVAVGMVLSQDLVRLVHFPVRDQPARRLGHRPHEDQLDDGREALHERGSTPRPVADDVVGAKSQPGGDDGSKIPGRVVDGGEDGAVLRVGQLGDEQRRGAVRDGYTKTEEEARGDEHAEVGGDGL